MRANKRFFAMLLGIILFFVGCTRNGSSDPTQNSSSPKNPNTNPSVSIPGGPTSHGDDVGNGGNPSLELFFKKAKDKAPAILEQLTREQLSKDIPQSIIEWIMAHKYELAVEVRMSPYVWSTSAQERCGKTFSGALSGEITLYFNRCELSVLSIEAAAQVLVHESIHHLGIKNEEEVDAIVTSLFKTVGRMFFQDEEGIINSDREGDLICIKKSESDGDYRLVLERFNGITRAKLYSVEQGKTHFLSRYNCAETPSALSYLVCEGKERGESQYTINMLNTPMLGHPVAYIYKKSVPGFELIRCPRDAK